MINETKKTPTKKDTLEYRRLRGEARSIEYHAESMDIFGRKRAASHLRKLAKQIHRIADEMDRVFETISE